MLSTSAMRMQPFLEGKGIIWDREYSYQTSCQPGIVLGKQRRSYDCSRKAEKRPSPHSSPLSSCSRMRDLKLSLSSDMLTLNAKLLLSHGLKAVAFLLPVSQTVYCRTELRLDERISSAKANPAFYAQFSGWHASSEASIWLMLRFKRTPLLMNR